MSIYGYVRLSKQGRRAIKNLTLATEENCEKLFQDLDEQAPLYWSGYLQIPLELINRFDSAMLERYKIKTFYVCKKYIHVKFPCSFFEIPKV